MVNDVIIEKAKKIKLLITDCDGVLTDTGVYYSAQGEELKRFSLRDGMGVERLRKFAGVDAGIMTGENSKIVARRAEKLKITELYLGVKDKITLMKKVLEEKNLTPEELAYIGDDTNDVEVMKFAGLTASPADATKFAKEYADIVVESKGGYGAFRDFVEIIISAKQKV
ncbi:MAG: 3-deoxy-D-manno-octulosonate 8-phosphate phosphatase [Melioribacteraceae bacterium]|nr:MAG: 3-deoxy-D-manno-octulosonate 8-phosphate phosphatase [Melioribacteraceae bacterium]